MSKQHDSFFKSNFPMNLHFTEYWFGYLAGIGGAISSFVVPTSPFLIFTIVLVFCDLYTGTRAARKRNEVIHSRGLRRTIDKIVLYFIAILLTEGMKKVFNLDFGKFDITYLTAFAIALTEFKSNIENIQVVTGVNIWEKISSAFSKK